MSIWYMDLEKLFSGSDSLAKCYNIVRNAICYRYGLIIYIVYREKT